MSGGAGGLRSSKLANPTTKTTRLPAFSARRIVFTTVIGDGRPQ